MYVCVKRAGEGVEEGAGAPPLKSLILGVSNLMSATSVSREMHKFVLCRFLPRRSHYTFLSNMYIATVKKLNVGSRVCRFKFHL